MLEELYVYYPLGMEIIRGGEFSGRTSLSTKQAINSILNGCMSEIGYIESYTQTVTPDNVVYRIYPKSSHDIESARRKLVGIQESLFPEILVFVKESNE